MEDSRGKTMIIKLYVDSNDNTIKSGDECHLVHFSAELTKQQYDALIGATDKHTLNVEFEEK